MPLPQLVRSSCESGLSIGNVRFFQTIGLHAEAQPTWFDSCTWSHVDPIRTSWRWLMVAAIAIASVANDASSRNARSQQAGHPVKFDWVSVPGGDA